MIYEPREDSFLLQKYVEKYAAGKVLDMGTGSGIQALAAMKKTKDVLAVDVDDYSVIYAKGKGVNAIQSDLFENVDGKFDLIIFNPPYLPKDINENKEVARLVSGGREGKELIEEFLSKVKGYLNKDGKILLAFTSLSGDVLGSVEKKGFRYEKLAEQSFFFERLYVYLVY